MKRALGNAFPLPGIDDANRAFFTAGVLTLQRCLGCNHVQHPPEEVCEGCQEMEFEDFASVGVGRVESVTVVHYPVHPALVEALPYAVVLVSVEDAPGILVTGNLVGTDPEEVRIGDAVRVVFEEEEDAQSGETLRIPQWEIVS